MQGHQMDYIKRESLQVQDGWIGNVWSDDKGSRNKKDTGEALTISSQSKTLSNSDLSGLKMRLQNEYLQCVKCQLKVKTDRQHERLP